MKITVKNTGKYVKMGSTESVTVLSGTIMDVIETVDYSVYVAYGDDSVLHMTLDDVIIHDINRVKRENIKKEMLTIKNSPNKGDKVQYTRSTKDGTVLGTHTGIVLERNFYTDTHFMFKIMNSITAEIHEIVINHPTWYKGDTIKLAPIEPGFDYYMAYDTRECKLLEDSAYKFKADTENYLECNFGDSWAEKYPHIEVRQVRITVRGIDS